MGKVILKTVLAVLAAIVVPIAITMLFTGKIALNGQGQVVKQAFMTENTSKKEYTVEEYLMMAMAANIDVNMNMETLKAQAVILRTWIYEKQLESEGSTLTMDKIGIETISLEQLKNKISIEEYSTAVSNLENAIYSTRGQILTYEEKPILAFFHYANNGQTRSYEEAYGEKIPYLEPVESSDDVEASVGVTTKVLKKSEVIKKLKEKYNVQDVTEDTLIEALSIKEKEESGYVHIVKLASLEIRGEDFKSLFGLNSTNFYFEEKDGDLRIICKGKGQGIGFSQYGANAMASRGKNYQELLLYYYKGVTLFQVDNMD
ncbi:MAG: SpoIID/LytB domain-containing protein [bacterium]|nr:SpoIID/LytB domain-containing protein [bacterium]